jgi:hypothetical protein
MVIALFGLSCWSWAVYHVSTGGLKFGSLSESILTYARFPELIGEAFNSIDPSLKVVSNSFIEKDNSFQQVNQLDYDLYGLNSFWDHKNGTWVFEMKNFRDNEVLHQWALRSEDLERLQFDDLMNSRPFHTLLLDNKSILIKFFSNLENGSFKGNYLLKLDANSRILWSNEQMRFHHSTEVDSEGNVWMPSTDLISDRFDGNEVLYNEYNAQIRNSNGVENYFRDDYITKIDPNTGEILYNKSVARILIENGYKGLLLGSVTTDFDPVHLNDIQPALTDTEYWQKDDLFLSLRNISTVLCYRPSENKVIWLKTGPFLNQHDVDITSDSTITIFNNNHLHQDPPKKVRLERGDQPFKNFVDRLSGNQVYVYNFSNDSSFLMYPQHFTKLEINSRTEGLSEVLANGDLFVEESNEGKIYVLNEGEIKFQKSYDSPVKDKIHLTNWIRIYEEPLW